MIGRTGIFVLSVVLSSVTVAVSESRAVAGGVGTSGGDSAHALQYAQARSEQVFEVEITDREVVPEMATIRVKQGDSVRIQWMTDEATEVHLHGYNVKTELEPGKPSEMVFEARATGRFAVTSHGFGGHAHGHHDEPTLVYVEVHP